MWPNVDGSTVGGRRERDRERKRRRMAAAVVDDRIRPHPPHDPTEGRRDGHAAAAFTSDDEEGTLTTAC